MIKWTVVSDRFKSIIFVKNVNLSSNALSKYDINQRFKKLFKNNY